VNAEGYEIHPLLLDMMHTKKFAGDDDMEDRYATTREVLIGAILLVVRQNRKMPLVILEVWRISACHQ
jgi:hypothetical protein